MYRPLSDSAVIGYIVPDTRGMRSPVICRHCGELFDLEAVNVTARYHDATVFRTPCCDREADDRPGKSLPDFSYVNPRL